MRGLHHRQVAVILSPIAALCLVAGIASADDPPAGQPAPILVAAQTAVAGNRVEKSGVLGFHDRNKPFNELPNYAAILIGFDLGVGKFGDIETIYALRPIYLTVNGEVRGQDHGLFADRPLGGGKVRKTKVLRTLRIQAPAGYAVGGMTVRSGLNINGLALTFLRIDGKSLDPKQARSSVWVGDRTGGSEKSVDGTGAPIVGIFGSQDDDHAMSLGLYFIVQPAEVAKTAVNTPATKPVAKPSKPPTEPVAVEPPAEPPQAASGAASWAAEDSSEETSALAASLWLPLAIFGGVVVMVFGVLLVSFGRKANAVRRDRKESDGIASQPPILDVLPVAPPRRVNWEDIPLPLPTRIAEGITATPPQFDGPPRPLREPMPLWPEPHNLRAPDPDAAQVAKVKKEVASALFGVAALQLICGLALVAIMPNQLAGGPVARQAIPFMAGAMILIAFCFAGLGWWAWFQPLPAAAVGLVVYVGLFLLDLAVSPQTAIQGMIVKVLIIAALGKAVASAAKLKGSGSGGW